MAAPEPSVLRTLRDAFSIVPAETAEQESKRLFDLYRRGQGSHRIIKWVDLDANGRLVTGGFIRGGNSEHTSLEVLASDPDLQRVLALVAESTVLPGTILADNDSKSFVWFVSGRTDFTIQEGRPPLKAIRLTQETVADLVNLSASDADLSPAEHRIIFQLLCGLSPGDAARQDEVSVETKRTQLKRTCLKLSCKGQSDLVRKVFGQLSPVLYWCEEPAAAKFAELHDFVAATFSGNVSLEHSINGVKTPVPYLDCGPSAGRPILLIHGYLFPFFIQGAVEQLWQRNLRLIMPVRPGFLASPKEDTNDSSAEALHHALTTLSEFIAVLSDEPVSLIGHSSGGLLCLELVRRRPEAFTTAVIASMNLHAERKRKSNAASAFFAAMEKLIGDNRIVGSLMRRLERTIFLNEKTFQVSARRIFRDSNDDLAAVIGQNGRGSSYRWWRQLQTTSGEGVYTDFRITREAAGNLHLEQPMRVTFLHSRNDPICAIEEIEQLVSPHPQFRLKTLADGGHFNGATHPDQLWSAIEAELNDQAK